MKSKMIWLVAFATACMMASVPSHATIYPDIYNSQSPEAGYLDRNLVSTDVQFGSLTWTSTGCAITTPTSATLFSCATHTVAGIVRGSVVATGGTTGTIVLGNKPGLYCADVELGSVTGVNSAVTSVQIWRKPGTAGTDAILATGGIGRWTNLATAQALHSQRAYGCFEVTKASAALAGGNILTVRVQSDTGNFTGKDGTFTVYRVSCQPSATGQCSNPATP